MLDILIKITIEVVLVSQLERHTVFICTTVVTHMTCHVSCGQWLH